eukprot:4713104-Prymnesium_polylepis.1
MEKLVAKCSEAMLTPSSALGKGLVYAQELEEWAKLFPRKQLRVIHTDDLAGSAQQVMNSTFRFLGLEPIDIGSQSRFCVHGKAGVMDVLNEDEHDVDIGAGAAGGARPAGSKDPKSWRRLQVGACDDDPEGMVTAASGAPHHKLEPELERRLRAYFEPTNQQLYKFLGRNLAW